MENSAEQVFEIFSQLNMVPRPSHHEGKAADWLCDFARVNNLEFNRDGNNCVVIRKPASPGCEHCEPLVILNHMDMVCVADQDIEFDPLSSPIQAYAEDGWMKARGTSLGADNGMGLSMALAILKDDTIVHPALEVLTTTNEEDGMSGASGLAPDFIKGRRVLNLDSEDYDTITVGAAGAYLQTHRIPLVRELSPAGHIFFRICIRGGLGGHSGVDINKGRGNANKLLFTLLGRIHEQCPMTLAAVSGGQASASIASSACAEIGVPVCRGDAVVAVAAGFSEDIKRLYGSSDPGMSVSIDVLHNVPETVFGVSATEKIINAFAAVPCGVIEPEGCDAVTTPVTSNNIGLVYEEAGVLVVTTHTRSFIDSEMIALGERIKAAFDADTMVVMSAPAWRESMDSKYVGMVSDIFEDVLGFRPRNVEMHFVLEAGYYVNKYPGIQIACIGPRIVCPHSTKEKVELETVENIWKVVKEILNRYTKMF